MVDVDASDLSPPVARRPRRSHRGLAFAVLFLVIVLIGLGAGAALFGVDAEDITGDNSGDVSAAGDTTSTTTTVPALPAPHPYKVTDGVNVRSGPGTNYADPGNRRNRLRRDRGLLDRRRTGRRPTRSHDQVAAHRARRDAGLRHE